MTLDVIACRDRSFACRMLREDAALQWQRPRPLCGSPCCWCASSRPATPDFLSVKQIPIGNSGSVERLTVIFVVGAVIGAFATRVWGMHAMWLPAGFLALTLVLFVIDEAKGKEP
jgi:hypothetical protein